MKRLLSIMVLLVTLFSIQSGIAESAGNTLQAMYQEAELLMVQGNYTEAASKFEAMGAYSDSSQMATYCKAVACAEMEMYDIAIVALEGLGEFKDCPQLAKYYTARYYEDMVRGGCILLALGEADADLRVYNELLKQTRDLYAELVLYKDSMTRYKDTERLYEDLKAANTARINAEKEKIYQQALSLEQQGQYLEAVDVYNQIPEYKDSKTKAEFCWETHHITIYQEAEDLIKDGKFEQAIEAFLMIADYKDATARVQMLHYELAEKALDEERYDEAITAFGKAVGYSNAEERIQMIHYTLAEKALVAGEYDTASTEFTAAGNYSDAATRVLMIHYDLAEKALASEKWDEASAQFTAAGSYLDAISRVLEPYYMQAEAFLKEDKELEAIAAFEKAGGFSDALLRISKTYYSLAQKKQNEQDYLQAAEYYKKTDNYLDSEERYKECYYTLASECYAKQDIGYALLYFRYVADYHDSAHYVSELTDRISNFIDASGDATACCTKDGRAFAVGFSISEEEIKAVGQWKDIKKISVYKSVVGLRTNGTVVHTGGEYDEAANKWKNIVAIENGILAFYGITDDGKVLISRGVNGTYEKEMKTWRNVLALSEESGLTKNGTVVSVDYLTKNWRDIVQISGPSTYEFGLVALTNDGTILCSSTTQAARELEQQTKAWKNTVAIACGEKFVAALQNDGTVLTAGSNDSIQCNEWENIVAIAAGDDHLVGVKADGSVIAIGKNNYGQCEVSAWKLW